MQRFIFCAVLCYVVGVVFSADTSYYAPGMRVKWGPVNDTAGRGKDFFFDIALTASEAESRDGWVKIKIPRGTRYASRLSMRCPADDFTICGIYDEFGDFAGLQVSVPVNGIKNPVPADERVAGAVLWRAPPTNCGKGQDYWTFQMFIVNGDSLKLSKEERAALRAAKNTVLYNDHFWVSHTDYYSTYKLRKVSDIETEMAEKPYDRQRCYMGMGRHYYYELATRRSCTDLDPWFPLVSSGGNQVHGIGFILQAVVPDPAPDSGLRTWFEYQTVSGINYTVPDGPRCQLDLTAVNNLRTIHMSFISEPWKIECTDEEDFVPLGYNL